MNFHNKQWLDTDTIVPDPAAPGRFAVTPKGYGITAFTLGSAGQVTPVEIGNPGGINLTAYWVGGAGRGLRHDHQQDARGAGVGRGGHDRLGRDRAWTAGPGAGLQGAEVMTLAGGQPGDATGSAATLGGAAITGDAPWDGEWSPWPPIRRRGSA